MTLPGFEIKMSYLTSSRFRYLTCRASNFVAFSLISLWSFIKSTFSWILDLNKRTVFNTSKHLNRQTNKQTRTSNQKKKNSWGPGFRFSNIDRLLFQRLRRKCWLCYFTNENVGDYSCTRDIASYLHVLLGETLKCHQSHLWKINPDRIAVWVGKVRNFQLLPEPWRLCTGFRESCVLMHWEKKKKQKKQKTNYHLMYEGKGGAIYSQSLWDTVKQHKNTSISINSSPKTNLTDCY